MRNFTHQAYIAATVLYVSFVAIKALTVQSILQQEGKLKEVNQTLNCGPFMEQAPLSVILGVVSVAGAIFNIIALHYTNRCVIVVSVVIGVLVIAIEETNVISFFIDRGCLMAAYATDIPMISLLTIGLQVLMDCLYVIIKIKMKRSQKTHKCELVDW